MRRRYFATIPATVGVLAVLAVGCGGGASNEASVQPATTPVASGSPSQSATPATPSNGPSQSAGDARRDGVVAALAALPFSARVGIVTAVTAPEGVWAISRPTAAAKKYASGCRLGPETGKYPTDTICTTEYGEVLLLNSQKTQILRAYPLAAVPPAYLVLTPDAVYCGRQGDTTMSETTLPDSMVCRIDRHTLAARVHVFAAPEGESEILQPCYFPPKNWTVTTGALRMTALRVDSRGLWARGAGSTWTRLDPTSLKVIASNVRGLGATEVASVCAATQ